MVKFFCVHVGVFLAHGQNTQLNPLAQPITYKIDRPADE